ncbi:MAG: UvrD-helicase domain-containing protein [Nitrospirota bacterium]
MSADLLKELNDKQKEAVLHTEGPLLILAGAGSGKTRVIAHRIAYLVDTLGIPPETIMGVTFTNKAAGEMKARVAALLPGARGQRVSVSTFHSVCLKILRQHIHLIGIKRDFVIYDAQDQNALMKTCLSDIGLDDALYPPKKLLGLIGQLKNQLITPDQYSAGFSTSPLQEKLKQVYTLYQEKLTFFQAVDFDDLIGLTLKLFSSQSDILNRYREQFQYLMVDEYQDTNFAQYRLIRLLISEGRNLCVVGDDDQSIYAFRGADVGNILKFERDFPDAKVVILDQNYRSTQAILSAADIVISQNKERKVKKLWTENSAGEPIVVQKVEDESEEAIFIGNMVSSERKKGKPLSDFCILYRTHAQSRVIEEGLRNRGLPYVIFGGIRFYERKEIKDLIAYLRVIVLPEDGVSLRRILNTPPRGIGEVSVQRLMGAAESQNISLYEAIGLAVSGQNQEGVLSLTGPGKRGLMQFFTLIEKSRSDMKTLSIADLLKQIIEKTAYLDYLQEEGKEENLSDVPASKISAGRASPAGVISRKENILEFISAAEQFTPEGLTEAPEGEALYKAFLDQIALIANETNNKTEESFVTLMTLHSAKGLEFETVFMVGMEEGVFPNARALNVPKEMEEERRLCYVGMTRARSRLYLTHAESRRLYGSTQHNVKSRFIKDLAATATSAMTGAAGGRWGATAARVGRGEYVDTDTSNSPAYAEYSDLSEAEMAERRSHYGAYPIGSRVRHPIFGVGQVQQYSGGDKITLYFSSVGTKKLALKYAKLEKV